MILFLIWKSEKMFPGIYITLVSIYWKIKNKFILIACELLHYSQYSWSNFKSLACWNFLLKQELQFDCDNLRSIKVNNNKQTYAYLETIPQLYDFFTVAAKICFWKVSYFIKKMLEVPQCRVSSAALYFQHCNDLLSGQQMEGNISYIPLPTLFCN